MSSSGRKAEGRGRILPTEACGAEDCLAIMRINARLASVSARGGARSCLGGRRTTNGSCEGGGRPPIVRARTSRYDCLRGVKERRRGSVEKPDCDVARRLAVAMSSEEGAGEIQIPS